MDYSILGSTLSLVLNNIEFALFGLADISIFKFQYLSININI